jgi:hypothetical protein
MNSDDICFIDESAAILNECHGVLNNTYTSTYASNPDYSMIHSIWLHTQRQINTAITYDTKLDLESLQNNVKEIEEFLINWERPNGERKIMYPHNKRIMGLKKEL